MQLLASRILRFHIAIHVRLDLHQIVLVLGEVIKNGLDFSFFLRSELFELRNFCFFVVLYVLGFVVIPSKELLVHNLLTHTKSSLLLSLQLGHTLSHLFLGMFKFGSNFRKKFLVSFVLNGKSCAFLLLTLDQENSIELC